MLVTSASNNATSSFPFLHLPEASNAWGKDAGVDVRMPVAAPRARISSMTPLTGLCSICQRMWVLVRAESMRVDRIIIFSTLG